MLSPSKSKRKIAMATYLELKARAEKLMAEAEDVRLKELNEVISDIKEKMKAYGLTGNDIGLGRVSKRKNPTASAKTGPTKYRGPNGETWSGGRGRKPNWVVKLLAAGKSLDDFAVGKRA